VTLHDRVADEAAPFSRIERAAAWLGKRTNLTSAGKRFQSSYLRNFSMRWVRFVLERRMLVEGLAELRDLEPERGVLLVANHRSFFDQYAALMAVMTYGARWGHRLNFPVRSEFFYDKPTGLFLNYFVAGGSMYPPIYRDTTRQALNTESLDCIVELLGTPGNLVGVHPEGTRGKGPDPYELLPAQPGVGKMALLGRPTVIPLFINGLSNSFVGDVHANFKPISRREFPLIVVFGQPIDYSDLLAEKPRPTLYKQAADRFMREVAELGKRERVLRAQCERGELPDEDVRWLTTYRKLNER
jgi:1-acyl-sn-glycerol-3-phosphate acyltransferase